MEIADKTAYQAFLQSARGGYWNAIPADAPITHVLDIGAHVGYFSVYARMRWPKAKILAVEPDPYVWELLMRNTDHMDISVLQRALGDGRPAALAARRWCYPARQYRSTDEAHATIPTSGLDGMTAELDQFVGSLGTELLLKVDCEGAEASIVEHPELSARTLQSCAALMLELHGTTRVDVSQWVCSALAGTHFVRFVERRCILAVRRDFESQCGRQILHRLLWAETRRTRMAL
jgi:FkbM family methyltransferase